jgi:hypothetical protein
MVVILLAKDFLQNRDKTPVNSILTEKMTQILYCEKLRCVGPNHLAPTYWHTRVNVLQLLKADYLPLLAWKYSRPYQH